MSGVTHDDAAGAQSQLTSLALATELVTAASSAGLSVATGESLTAGLVAAAIADVPGASAVLRGGVVSYAVDVKASVLGVDRDLLAERGPVDPDVAEAMAVGAASVCGADIGISTTGVAGPDAHGGHLPGTVYIGWSGPNGSGSRLHRFEGSRSEIREASVRAALRAALDCVT